MTVTEKIASAILAKVPQGYGMTQLEALEYARAAVAAMRDNPVARSGEEQKPTLPIAIIRVGYEAAPNSLNMPLSTVWNAMIDAILTEKLSTPSPTEVT